MIEQQQHEGDWSAGGLSRTDSRDESYYTGVSSNAMSAPRRVDFKEYNTDRRPSDLTALLDSPPTCHYQHSPRRKNFVDTTTTGTRQRKRELKEPTRMVLQDDDEVLQQAMESVVTRPTAAPRRAKFREYSQSRDLVARVVIERNQQNKQDLERHDEDRDCDNDDLFAEEYDRKNAEQSREDSETRAPASILRDLASSSRTLEDRAQLLHQQQNQKHNPAQPFRAPRRAVFADVGKSRSELSSVAPPKEPIVVEQNSRELIVESELQEPEPNEITTPALSRCSAPRRSNFSEYDDSVQKQSDDPADDEDNIEVGAEGSYMFRAINDEHRSDNEALVEDTRNEDRKTESREMLASDTDLKKERSEDSDRDPPTRVSATDSNKDQSTKYTSGSNQEPRSASTASTTIGPLPAPKQHRSLLGSVPRKYIRMSNTFQWQKELATIRENGNHQEPVPLPRHDAVETVSTGENGTHNVVIDCTDTVSVVSELEVPMPSTTSSAAAISPRSRNPATAASRVLPVAFPPNPKNTIPAPDGSIAPISSLTENESESVLKVVHHKDAHVQEEQEPTEPKPFLRRAFLTPVGSVMESLVSFISTEDTAKSKNVETPSYSESLKNMSWFTPSQKDEAESPLVETTPVIPLSESVAGKDIQVKSMGLAGPASPNAELAMGVAGPASPNAELAIEVQHKTRGEITGPVQQQAAKTAAVATVAGAAAAFTTATQRKLAKASSTKTTAAKATRFSRDTKYVGKKKRRFKLGIFKRRGKTKTADIDEVKEPEVKQPVSPAKERTALSVDIPDETTASSIPSFKFFSPNNLSLADDGNLEAQEMALQSSPSIQTEPMPGACFFTPEVFCEFLSSPCNHKNEQKETKDDVKSKLKDLARETKKRKASSRRFIKRGERGNRKEKVRTKEEKDKQEAADEHDDAVKDIKGTLEQLKVDSRTKAIPSTSKRTWRTRLGLSKKPALGGQTTAIGDTVAAKSATKGSKKPIPTKPRYKGFGKSFRPTPLRKGNNSADIRRKRKVEAESEIDTIWSTVMEHSHVLSRAMENLDTDEEVDPSEAARIEESLNFLKIHADRLGIREDELLFAVIHCDDEKKAQLMEKKSATCQPTTATPITPSTNQVPRSNEGVDGDDTSSGSESSVSIRSMTVAEELIDTLRRGNVNPHER